MISKRKGLVYNCNKTISMVLRKDHRKILNSYSWHLELHVIRSFRAILKNIVKVGFLKEVSLRKSLMVIEEKFKILASESYQFSLLLTLPYTLLSEIHN